LIIALPSGMPQDDPFTRKASFRRSKSLPRVSNPLKHTSSKKILEMGNNLQKLSVKIIDIKLERAAGEKKILFFQILVSFNQDSWILFKSTDQILEFYKILVNEYRSADSGGIVPSLPPRILSLISSNSPKIVKYIISWFNKTLENQTLGSSSLLISFFEKSKVPDSHSFYNFHEGYLCALHAGNIDSENSIYWKKARWTVMNYGVIFKYKIKGDKHPYGVKLLLVGPGGLVQKENELEFIRIAQSSANGVVYPFYLSVQKKRKRKMCSFWCFK